MHMLIAFVALAFEVVSIRPNLTHSESRSFGSPTPGGRFTAINVPVKLVIARAFGVAESQIARGPDWIEAENYDIVAKAAVSKELTKEELRPYLQSMLADRFHLKFHRESKEAVVYALTAAKGGPKVRQHAGAGNAGIGVSTEANRATITATRSTMARLAEYLSGQAGRPVIDRTNLAGEFDFTLDWMTDSNASGASIFAALQEQLGLKLESGKAPIEMIVIDSVERATPN